MSCGVGHRCSSYPSLLWLWLWCRPAAVALIRPLVWEPLYAVGVALKRQKKKAQFLLRCPLSLGSSGEAAKAPCPEAALRQQPPKLLPPSAPTSLPCPRGLAPRPLPQGPVGLGTPPSLHQGKGQRENSVPRAGRWAAFPLSPEEAPPEPAPAAPEPSRAWLGVEGTSY